MFTPDPGLRHIKSWADSQIPYISPLGFRDFCDYDTNFLPYIYSSFTIMKFVAVTFAALATTVLGHSTFQQLSVDNVDQAGTCVRTPLNNNPVTSVSGNDIRCNTGTKPVAGVCNVAGS